MKTNPQPASVELQTYTPRIVALCLLAILLLLILTGCKGNAAAGSAKLDPAGVYSLASVDGKSVPCVISHQGPDMKIQSGTFTITADGRCSSAITISVADKRDINVVTKATWTCQGTALTMRWEGAGTTLGNVSGNNFTMTNEGMVFAYRK